METSVLAKVKIFSSLLNHLRWSVAICEIFFVKWIEQIRYKGEKTTEMVEE
jgi:hypothetical protein